MFLSFAAVQVANMWVFRSKCIGKRILYLKKYLWVLFLKNKFFIGLQNNVPLILRSHHEFLSNSTHSATTIYLNFLVGSLFILLYRTVQFCSLIITTNSGWWVSLCSAFARVPYWPLSTNRFQTLCFLRAESSYILMAKTSIFFVKGKIKFRCQHSCSGQHYLLYSPPDRSFSLANCTGGQNHCLCSISDILL